MDEPQTLIAGIAFGESPRWHDGRLWVSDWAAQEIIAVDDHGHREVVVRVDFPGFPMCIDWLDDRLLIVSGRHGRLLRREPGGELATYADLSPLATTPWNDIVVDGRGNAYVNNTGFDFPQGEFAPGSIALVRPDGSVTQVADGLAFPNGMAVTADNSTLIVAESYAGNLTAFDIDADGSLSGRRVWADLGQAPPDGICIDADGAVWYADVGNRNCVRVAEGGEVLDTVQHDRGCFACMLGGPDGATLYIVAQEWNGPDAAGGGRTGQVLSVAAPARGAGWPGPG
jgi:sugar lactone lactonase YvrE